MDYSQSQGMSQRSREALSEEQLAAATIKVKDYLLSDMKYLRKFKKDEIVVNALNKSSKQYGEIMKRVKKILLDVFGVFLATLPKKDNEFIMVNENPSKYLETLELETISYKEEEENTVLQVALASIFMKKGSMYESHLFRIFETIGFNKDSFYTEESGRKSKDFLPKLLSNLVKQMYLDVQKVEPPKRRVYPPLSEENKVMLYRWGYRALLEVDVDGVLKFICQMHNGRRPDSFPPGYFIELKEQQNKLREELEL